jgi:mannobiose 2-epimerase
MKEKLEKHLLAKIVPFWTKLADWNHGGFYAVVDANDLSIKKEANKGLVQHARILWTFSALENKYKDGRFRPFMDLAYRFLMDTFADKMHPGFFWIVQNDGALFDSRKVTYGQGFAIYGLAEYYKATHISAALEKARETFDWIEKNAFDTGAFGYWEEFSRDWKRTECQILGDGIPKTVYTVNTGLHLLEAYVNLFEAQPDEAVRQAVVNLIRIFETRMYNSFTGSLTPYFDGGYQSLDPLCSFGHNIEASWLIDEASRKVGLNDPKLSVMTDELANTVLKNGFNGNYVATSERNGKKDLSEVWWVQSEAMTGFYNQYQKTKKKIWLIAFKNVWKSVNDRLVDSRPEGEWFWSADETGAPNLQRGIAEIWKTPYHNGRCLLELMERMDTDDPSSDLYEIALSARETAETQKHCGQTLL